MNGRKVLVDCRWLGYSGVGRVTEMLLSGLKELGQSSDRTQDLSWSLWGSARTEELAWPGAEIILTEESPLAWASQRSFFSVPAADLVIWPHAVRPLISRTSIVLIHDLIPVHWSSSGLKRQAWKQFYGRSCRTATVVAVNSDATGDSISEELHIRDWVKVSYPIDSQRAGRIRSMRTAPRSPATPDRMIYVGQVKRHKNLVRAVEAFRNSDFFKTGGVFTLLAGGATDPVELEAVNAASAKSEQIEVLPRCSDEELDALYASASFLIQPSLEEGYGLPVAEALASGIPVCCSNIAALSEAARGLAEMFDPELVESITETIDATAAKAASGYEPELDNAPTTADFAQQFLDLVERAST